MARTKFNCTACRIKNPVGTRNFKDSSWCKRCNSWKPKTQVSCECCTRRLRTVARAHNSVIAIEHKRL